MMTFNYISRLNAAFLAALILVSSLTVSVDFHFCQGELKSVSLFGKAKNCHQMAKKISGCCHNKKASTVKKLCSEEDKNCCNNERVLVASNLAKDVPVVAQLDLSDEFELSNLSILPLFHSLTLAYKDVHPYAHYKPPLIKKLVSILFQIFLF